MQSDDQPASLTPAQAEEMAIVSRASHDVPTLSSKPRHNTPLLNREQWLKAEAMYVSGATLPQIAAFFGILPIQVTRHATHCGWTAKRQTLVEAQKSLATADSTDKRSLARSKFLDDMQTVVEQGVSVLKNDRPSNRRQLRAHFQAAREVLEVAKPILGLEGNGAGAPQLINMQFLMTPEKFIRQAVDVVAESIPPIRET